MDIVIIGAGNVAHHIARSFKNNSGINIVQAFNHRSSKIAKSFAKQNNIELVTDYNQIHKNAALYFVCVKDDVLSVVAHQLSALKLQGLVVHTSGSMDLTTLEKSSKHYGVYYPLQTFSATSIINWKTTPILIEASSPTSLKTLRSIASAVSLVVKVVNSKARLKLHLAAVLASNFTNALHAAAFDFIETNFTKKDTILLKPLMQESFGKLNALTPKQAQTGPAMRNDKVVMKKHLALLRSDKQLTSIYKLLSDLIIKQQGIK